MRILVVGGTGHIGSYLVPRLLMGGHQVMVLARNPVPQHADPRLLWGSVEWIVADREQEERDGCWEARMRAVEAEVVVDITAQTPSQCQSMYRAFNGRLQHYLFTGTIWAYGPCERIPYEEHFPRKPICSYGCQNAASEAWLLRQYRTDGFPATIIHPGHISGRRWLPIDPQGSRNGIGVYRKLATGQPVQLADNGLATLHHVHADDLAQLYEAAILNRERALGEAFNGVAPYAMSLLGCTRACAAFFGREAMVEFVPLAKMADFEGAESATIIASHAIMSPCCSIEKGRRLLDYRPRYTTERIYAECIEYLLECGQLP